MKMTSIFTILVKKKYNNAVSNIFALAQRALKGAFGDVQNMYWN